MQIRKATPNDLTQIIEVINDAKALLKKSGSMQWNTDGYPNEESFTNDINNNECYIIEEDIILGVMSVVFTKDRTYEAYPEIWTKPDYCSIHRIAVRQNTYHKGIATKLFDFAHKLAKENSVSSIRIDTHRLNTPMLGLLNKFNYSFVGKINLKHQTIDNERLAYEKII